MPAPCPLAGCLTPQKLRPLWGGMAANERGLFHARIDPHGENAGHRRASAPSWIWSSWLASTTASSFTHTTTHTTTPPSPSSPPPTPRAGGRLGMVYE